MSTVSIKASQVYTIEYRKQTVMLATKLSDNKEYTALLWKVGNKETSMFVLRTRYIVKHGLVKAVEAAVNAGKIPRDVQYFLRRLQSTLGSK